MRMKTVGIKKVKRPVGSGGWRAYAVSEDAALVLVATVAADVLSAQWRERVWPRFLAMLVLAR